MNNFAEAKALLEKSQRILFTTHQRTDGDDLGSVLALALHLRKEGKEVTIAVIGGVPEQLRYLALTEQVQENITHENFDLLVISGCSAMERVGNEKIANLQIPKINFDHHPDNTSFGDVNVVDSTKSAVAELVYDFFKASKWPIDHEIAMCLLTGIVTDTGIFMHSNTKASTLEAAAELVNHGARVSTVTKHTYQGKDLNTLRAWSKALSNVQYDPDQKMVYSILTGEEISELGELPATAFEGIVETLNKVPEAKFAMFLKQDKDVIKGSLRSEEYKGIDVQKIARSLGGGGHKLASGFSLIGKLIKNDQGKWQVV